MSTSSLLRYGALSLTFALMGAGMGYLLLPEQSPEAANLPPVRVRGRAIPQGRDAHAVALEIARSYLREHVTVQAEGHSVERTREGFGARVDVAVLARLIASARDPSSSLMRHHAAIARGPIDLPLPVHVEGSVALPLVMQLKEEADHVAVDARIDVEARRVIPERWGTYVDVYGTVAALDRAFAEGRRTVSAVLERTRPGVLAEQLRDVEMNAVVGWFQTNYNANEDHRDRTYNLHLAAERINGYVWLPGAVFDFNQVVGDRSEANGFRMATVISAGELIDGVGGGTCQIAGTLFAASFFAGMEVLDRRPHTRPSGYIKMGLDATVVYPSINLRMRNNLPFPVVIHRRIGNGVLRLELLGARSTRTVTFVRKIMPRVDRFEEREQPDANLPAGMRVLTQRGIPGFHITRYRILREGDQAVRERWQDAYPPTMQIWHVGTGAALGAGPVARQDDHPEYTADQYLAVTQMAGTNDMQEVRRPGFSGTAGWMVREHLTRPIPAAVEAAMVQAGQARAAQRGAPAAPPRGAPAPARGPARPAARPR
ncbi:MAG: VanW family protein [Polyangiales bacterium]